MIYLPQVIRRLEANAQVIAAFIITVSPEQARWKPDEKSWSLTDVMSHVYNEERVDFRKHLKEMFSDPPLPWNGIPHRWIPQDEIIPALEGFLAERADSLAWLAGLEGANWEVESQAQFGDEVMVLRAGDVLASWVEHDFLHIRQMNELHYAWIERQAAPFRVEYAGGW